MIVDCAYYRDGARQPDTPRSIAAAAECAHLGDGFVWLGIHEPTDEELVAVQESFGLHELAIEDAKSLHQRAKLEAYGNCYFVVLRTVSYDDETEDLEFGEIHIFSGSGFAISVRHGEASALHAARQRLEARPELLAAGPAAVTWAVIDKVVDDYEPVVDSLEADIEDVEEKVFEESRNLSAAPSSNDQTQRIYSLKREVIEFFRAVHPLVAPLAAAERGSLEMIPDVLHPYFRDVNDHLKLVHEEIASQRELLTSVLEANLAVLSHRQNEVVRTISAWAAIIAVPTFIASVYGMNFDHMPELHWRVGYPLCLLAMALTAIGLYRFFRRARWL
jgi:magnesium transporter